MALIPLGADLGSGLLADQLTGIQPDYGRARANMLLSLGAGLLGASAPSTDPGAFQRGVGSAVQNSLAAYQQGRQQALENALLKRRIGMENQQLAREKRLRDIYPTAFNEDGTVNPAAIKEIASVSPDAARQLASIVPQAQAAPDPKYQIITKTTPDGRQLQGRIDVNAPDPEATFQPIGSPETPPIPAEASAKKAAIDQALSLIPQMEEMLFTEDGDFRETVVADTPFISTNPKRRAFQPLMLSSIEAVIRAESGATVPPEEIRRAAQRYMPSVLDPDSVARAKIDLLKDRLARAQEAFEVGRPGSRTSGATSQPQGSSFTTPSGATVVIEGT